jgi:putative ABC transport system substrate-binding protein
MYYFNNLIQTFKLIVFYLLISLSSAQSSPTKISILQLVEHSALDATREGLLEELNKLGYRQGENLVLEFQSAQGNPTLAVQIAQKFMSNNPDMIVAIPTIAAQAAMNATKDTGIPVVFSSVTDPIAAKLVTSLEAPKGNVTGVSNFVPVEPQFQLFKRVLPTLKTLGIIYNPGEANSTALNAMMEKAAPSFGLTLVMAVASKSSEVSAATRSLCGKVDAVFVNNDNTALSAFKSVVKAAQACGIPAFVSDIDIADQGALAALGPDQREVGRQTARMVDFILKNPDKPLPPVEFPEKTEEYVDKE